MWLLRLNRTPRLLILSVLLGLVGGFGAQLFLLLLHLGDIYLIGFLGHYHPFDVNAAHVAGIAPKPFSHWYWLVPLATTVGGLVSGFLVYTFAPEAEGHGTDAAVRAFHRTAGRMRARVPLVKTIASAITIGSGGSAGREGPTAQIAAGVGSILGAIFKLPDDERRLLILMGMAAGLSAIFKSPLGTAIFAVEILYSRMAFEGSALVYTLIAAAVGYAVAGAFRGYTPLFILPTTSGLHSPLDLGWFAGLGIVAGVLGAILPTIFYRMRDWFRDIRIPNHFKPAIGGLALGLIGIALPPLLGGGYGYIQFALSGGAGLAVWFLLLLSLGKILALSLTIGSGGSGGVFAPSLYVGAMLGAAFAATLTMFHIGGPDASALGVVGMAALFAGAARVPIASLVMVVEMTGGYGLIMPAMVAVALAFLVQFTLTRRVKYPTLYEAQVPTPADSPVYRDTYYQAAAQLLRRQQVTLDRDILTSELQSALERGEGVALSRRKEQLYSLSVPPGSSVVGREVRTLGLAELGVLIIGLIRAEGEIMPHGGTKLQVGDGLLVAATPESIGKFREILEPPKGVGEIAAEEASEETSSESTNSTEQRSPE